jgi:hypothetical protein
MPSGTAGRIPQANGMTKRNRHQENGVAAASRYSGDDGKLFFWSQLDRYFHMYNQTPLQPKDGGLLFNAE